MVKDLLAAVGARWQARDPLLPAPRPPAPEAHLLTVTNGTGPLVAAGTATRATSDPVADNLAWFAADRFSLSPLVAGPDLTGALDRLLSQWHRSIGSQARAAGPDSSASVWLPARDTEAVAALVGHGLTPVVVIAARHGQAASPPAPTGVRVRRATPADGAPVSALWHALVRYESQFGTGHDRPTVAAHLRADADRMLSAADPWIWLAEHDGRPVGLMMVWPPADNGWLAPFTSAAPIAYIGTTWVDPAHRGGGVGAALVDAAHETIDASGAAVTLLHYGLLNPLSGPFWHRAGYRPLWTGWQAQPAAALR